MNQMSFYYTNDIRSKQIADLERENKWLKPFWARLLLCVFSKVFNLNIRISVDEISLKNGIKYAENDWKIYTLHSNKYSEKEKDSLIKKLELFFKGFEKTIKDNLKSEKLLIE